jgi:hypothetical protein
MLTKQETSKQQPAIKPHLTAPTSTARRDHNLLYSTARGPSELSLGYRIESRNVG